MCLERNKPPNEALPPRGAIPAGGVKGGAQILRDGGGVQLSGHLQAVVALHPADGFGQHLSGLHGGHLPAGLRQVAEPSQPRL